MSGTNSLIVAGQLTSGDLFLNGSYYWSLGGYASGNLTEANVQRKLQAGTVSGLGIQLVVNNSSGGSVINIWFRKAAANGAVNVNVAGVGTGWFQDTTHSDSVTAGTLCNLAHTANTNAPDFECASNCLTFNAASPLSSMLWANSSGLGFASTTNSFAMPASGQFTNTIAAEASAQVVARAAGSYSKLECYVSANTIATGGSTIAFRIGGADGNQTLPIPTLTTGQFQDTTHSDSVLSGNLIDYRINAGAATNTLTVNLIDTSNSGSLSAQDLVNGSNGSSYGPTQTSQFYALSGTTINLTTESLVQIKTNFATTLSRLRLNLLLNSLSVTTHWVSRKNTAAGNMTLSLTNATTGAFEDTTHSDSVVGTDLVNTEFVANGGSGGASLNYIAVTADDGSSKKGGGFFHVFP